MNGTYNPLGAKTSLADIAGGFTDFLQQMQMMEMIKKMFPEQPQQQQMPETPLPQGRMLPAGQQQQQQFNPLAILGQAPSQFGQGQQFGGGQGGARGGFDINQLMQMLKMLGIPGV